MNTHQTPHGVVHTSDADNGPFAWSCIHEDYDGASMRFCATGYGHTEEEAIADLMDLLDNE